jgi:hypothetical protein
VSGNVPVAEATRDEAVLPERVQEALGQLVGAAKEGLLALSVGVGLGVLTELMEEEVDDVVGPKGKHNAERTAVRHGHEAGEVTLSGRHVEVQRPRVRTADGESELPVGTYQHFADRDPLRRRRPPSQSLCEHPTATAVTEVPRRPGQPGCRGAIATRSLIITTLIAAAVRP